MKVWPIITLGALLYGSTFSDSRNVGRESNPHPHRSMIDAEIAADFAPVNMPHRPVTMAFREVFAKLLNDETEWSAPEGKATAITEDADADDGEDPGKKLFWRSRSSGDSPWRLNSLAGAIRIQFPIPIRSCSLS